MKDWVFRNRWPLAGFLVGILSRSVAEFVIGLSLCGVFILLETLEEQAQ